MELDRRNLIALAAAAGPLSIAERTQAAPGGYAPAAGGIDASHYGLRPGNPEDQSRILQRAIDETARAGTPLLIPPGVYRIGDLKLPDGAQLIGARGATKLALTHRSSLISAVGADHLTLSGLVLDGLGALLPEPRGLVQLEHCRAIKVADCEIKGCGGNALVCTAVSGQVSDNTFTDASDAAIHVLDAAGLIIARNRIDSVGNNGIQVWRSMLGDDGTLVLDNRIENVSNRSGGSGQYGNAINVFRAANVIVRGNRISNCAFSAVHGNAASNLHIEGNSINNVGEVALYAEFGFEGAVIANNSVDRAAIGISVTNFNEGGRLAVVQGNIIRNDYALKPLSFLTQCVRSPLSGSSSA